MLTLELDMYQACALGALVYCLGRLLVQKLPFLSKYCIPAPVAGGVVFAFAHLALYATGVLELSFDTTLQSVFMTIFFCSVGFTACFRLLKKGGVRSAACESGSPDCETGEGARHGRTVCRCLCGDGYHL